MIKLFPLFILCACFLPACSNSSLIKLTPAQPPTGAEDSLFNEVNKVRQVSGRAAVKRSNDLDALAASESSRLAESGSRTPNVSALRSHTNYGSTAVLVGSLKDRGPATGASFPGYWLKGQNEKEHLLGRWHRVGVGTAKSSSGDLVSIVIFGGLGN